MAKLSAHGTEMHRVTWAYQVGEDRPDPTPVRTTYVLYSDGWVLTKSVFHPENRERRHGTGWTRAGRPFTPKKGAPLTTEMAAAWLERTRQNATRMGWQEVA